MDEGQELIRLHWEEVAHYQDIPLAPHWDAYLKLESNGNLMTFTIREDDGERPGEFVGYGLYVISLALHYRSSLQAHQDIIFIRKDRRGCGGGFISWCDDRLAERGVQAVSHHVKKAHNWGRVLERKGYELMDLIYVRRLD